MSLLISSQQTAYKEMLRGGKGDSKCSTRIQLIENSNGSETLMMWIFSCAPKVDKLIIRWALFQIIQKDACDSEPLE